MLTMFPREFLRGFPRGFLKRFLKGFLREDYSGVAYRALRRGFFGLFLMRLLMRFLIGLLRGFFSDLLGRVS